MEWIAFRDVCSPGLCCHVWEFRPILGQMF
jgi:hypothetical protein